MLAVIDTAGISVGDVVVLAGLVIAGLVGWRSKRGEFYKAVAEEKTAEADKLREERDALRKLTDITPILASLDKVTQALERHARMSEEVFQKVAEMNGSLRAHSQAMQALADRLILDEAARALLAEAAKSQRGRAT